jgi:S1-C subfamily serine protease
VTLDKQAGDQEPGVTVREVLPHSAAAKAGLKPGDRLLILDDRWTDTLADCYAAAGYVKPGTEAKVTLRRGDREIELTVRPDNGL